MGIIEGLIVKKGVSGMSVLSMKLSYFFSSAKAIAAVNAKNIKTKSLMTQI